MGITPLKINPRKNKTLLCFGIISREKGHPYLLEAMKSLKDHDLILAGNPVDKKYQQELSTIIKENKLNNVIVDFGWISEERKAHYYEMASILVLPYTWGPYTSAVIHDAMSYNMPVVVSKVGAVWEVIDVFKTGSVVKPKNSKALIKGIKDVEKDFSTFTKNINKYRKKADWIEVAKKTKSLYQRVLRK